MITSVCSGLARLVPTILFITTLVSAALAQGPASVHVHVIDPLGAAVPRARVTLMTRTAHLRWTAVTDNAGVGTFDRVAPGDYLIEIEATGFTRPEPMRVFVEAGERRDITVAVALAGVNDYVVITASGTAQRVGELSKAARVVDREAMSARDDRTIADALRLVPGLRIQQLGGLGAATSINIRGLRNEDTAVLIDGMRFRDAGATQGDASTFLSDLLITNLDRVEVLSGSGSSLYGSHAIGGVLNVITQSGAGPLGGSLLAESGGLGTTRAHLGVGGGVADNRVTYRVGATRLDVSSGVDGDDQADNTSGQASFGITLRQRAHVSARFYGADAATMINEGPSAVGVLPAGVIVAARPVSPTELARYESGTPISQLEIGDATFIPSANDPDNRRTSSFRSTLVGLSHQAAGRVGYTVAYHHMATSRRFDDGPLGVSGFEPSQATRSDFEGSIQTLSGRTHLQLTSRHVVTAGYEFETERYMSRSSATSGTLASTADIIERSHTAFVQDQASLTNALEISGGFRVQRFALETPRFTPPDRAPYAGLTFEAPPVAYTADGSAVYAWPSAQTRVRAHVGTGYRAPSLFERFGSSYGRRGYSVYGDPRLAPERSVAADVGMDRDVARGRLRLSATGFATRLRDVIIFDFSGAISPAVDPFGRSSGYRTTDRMTSRGLELQVTGAPIARTRIDGSYTYAYAAPRTGGPPEATQASAIPRHLFSLALMQRLGTQLQVSVDATMSSAHLATLPDPVTFVGRTFRFPGIRRTNVAAVYTRPLVRRVRLRVFGRIDDVFGSTTYESGFRIPGRWGTLGAGVEF